MSQVKKKSILVVDDTRVNLRLLVEMLTKHGYRVRSAPSGKQALDTVQKELPDLILLDILMPGMDGFEVCKQLKGNEHTKNVPVIFLSALNEVFDKVTAFAVGGVDYITKPFQVEEVLARINTHLHLEEMRHILEVQNQQLQEQNKELDAFARTVAHDLKNPLAKISASLSIIQSDAENLDAHLREALQIGINSGFKMSDIIDELLLLSSVRKEEIQLEPVNMQNVVNQAVNRLSQMVDVYQPKITFAKNWPEAQGYEPWIEEVWANYISNGLKYGGQPPSLELGGTTQPNGMIRFWVRDNGPGISPEAQAKLFTEFTRLDKNRAEGHGLGLSIVRRIMDKLDGQFGVQSALGQGCTFYFTLPAAG